MSRKVSIGLALGGGGARGMAHLGILKVFEKYGIKPNFIAGTSAGSIIGAAYALGYSADEILERGRAFNSKKFSAVKNFNFFSESLIKDKAINRAIKDIIGEDKTFKDIKIPFVATAIDLEDGKELIITKGKLWEVARASSAIPFVFTPMFLDKHYLVDGGLLNNIPVDHVRNIANPDIVIGIDVGGMTSRQYISGIVWQKYYYKPKSFRLAPSFLTKMKMNTTLMAHIMLRSIDIMREFSQEKRVKDAHPDLIITPNLASVSLLDFNKYEEAVVLGMEAAEKVMPELLELIRKKSGDPYAGKSKGIVEPTQKK